jgi:p-hydroxybenzoate 3-monooxygenase
MTSRTQVAIIGAGPAGLFLAHLLHRAGVAARVIENRSRAYVEGRVRAGVLERTTVELMDRLGVGARMHREGIVHQATNLAVGERLFRVDFTEVSPDARVMLFGQSEVMRDLGDAAVEREIPVVYEASEVALHDVDGDAPSVTFTHEGKAQRVACEYIVGCDGFHGVSRGTIPAPVRTTFERVYPFGWLGILADVPPCMHELVYANHERGFALASMRSPTRSRYYVQCSVEEKLEDWPDERFWDEVSVRLGSSVAPHITRGASFEKSIAPLRSMVCEPMRWGRLFLTGDAAHIVPPTGAKGLNLAVSDVIFLAEALGERYAGHGPGTSSGSTAGIDGYSARALARVWRAERFTWWFTSLMHRFPTMDSFDRRMQSAELEYLADSKAARAVFIENYIGLPL